MYVTVDGKQVGMVLLLLLAVVLPGVLYLCWPSEKTVETGSWGLSFGAENVPPRADATPESLRQYDARYIGDTGEKTIYLTFDCGYENGNTERILDVLKAHNAPGTFFVVGHYIESAPELLKRMVAEGHTVGNHTWSHPDMSEISDRAAFQAELRRVEEAYSNVTGQAMARYYRPPRGIYSTENLQMAKEEGYQTVFWSLAYVDWNQDRQPEEEDALDLLCRRIHPGAVVLLHNTSATNAAILDRLLTRWEEMGYAFGTADALFQD